jgi:metallo-beta-lactamase class B
MRFRIQPFLLLIISIVYLNCGTPQQQAFTPKEVYKTEGLIITQITENSFEHTSYKQTNDFGNVPCNGLIVKNNGEVVIFDTPTNDSGSIELIKWVTESLHCKINAVVPTHFHDDCLGGLKAFSTNSIPSYASAKTIELANKNNYPAPQNGFADSLTLRVGSETVIIRYFGEGHTKDNVVGYFPSEDVLFGGCLIKELDASKGYLGDANVADWSKTVENVKQAYPNVKIVVPGHGTYGNKELLDYTIQLFKKQ